MDKEELKKKILTIVRGAMIEADELPFLETTDNIADALIAAGYGDVKEAEHRAKVLGRTLAIMKGKGLISGVVDDYIAQAEKELAEEGEDD